eukprot:GHVN01038110.1.p1 GENE.GHVN01038110.1~~GHVN01038110.1.p1  ORF type:complete len:238 (-),score=33.46 GHVN01038110.1:185-898(-)
MKFRDHFVPVPVRRHVIPKVIFTHESYEVECIREKPVLVVEDYFKPVAVDVGIKLTEKDVSVNPIQPTELSQADHHAMWMRVNADLLDVYKEDHAGERPPPVVDNAADEEGGAGEEPDGREHEPEEGLGPLPLHPGHPAMMTFLQNQWMNNPTTLTQNMYSPEFFRHHATAMNNVLDPQPHQINLTEQQGQNPPHEAIPIPWEAPYPEYPQGQQFDSQLPPTQPHYQPEAGQAQFYT